MMNVRLQADPAVRARIDSGAHEDASEQFVARLYKRGYWKDGLPDHVLVIARVGRERRCVSRVDIVNGEDGEIRAVVCALARPCNAAGEEV